MDQNYLNDFGRTKTNVLLTYKTSYIKSEYKMMTELHIRLICSIYQKRLISLKVYVFLLHFKDLRTQRDNNILQNFYVEYIGLNVFYLEIRNTVSRV